MIEPNLAYTVIVPCFNSARTITKVLECLHALRPPPERIVVVDDHSIDQTIPLTLAFGDVEVIENDGNQGAPAARNIGAGQANTPYLLFIDSDCYLEPAGLTVALELLERRADLAGVMGVFSPNGPLSCRVGHYKNLFRHHEIIAMNNPPPIFNSSCFLIRRNVFLDIEGFRAEFGIMPTEDNEFYFRLVKRGYIVEYLSRFCFLHDKPMKVAHLFADDTKRAKAIIMNISGKLGAPRSTWDSGERAKWLLELVAANLLVVSTLIVILGLFISMPLAYISSFACIFAWSMMVYLNRRPLKAALGSQGPVFLLCALLLRVVELLAATLGIAMAIPAFFAPPSVKVD